MRVRELLTRERTMHDLPGVSKKRLFDQVSSLASDEPGAPCAQEIFDGLVARERLGSTGMGEGVAIPHCRLDNCDTPTGLLLKLANPIDFESIDGKPVDLVFVLLVPKENPDQHVKILGHLASLFSQASYRQNLRSSKNLEDLFAAAASSEEELQLAS